MIGLQPISVSIILGSNCLSETMFIYKYIWFCQINAALSFIQFVVPYNLHDLSLEIRCWPVLLVSFWLTQAE